MCIDTVMFSHASLLHDLASEADSVCMDTRLLLYARTCFMPSQQSV